MRNLLVGPIAVIIAFAPAMLACGRDSRAADSGGGDGTALIPSHATCSHAACGTHFVVDAASVGSCAVGGACTMALALVATGEYHINDEYPYKFKADDQPGVEFLGTDEAGSTVFSKSARNWTKTGEKTGTMTVSFMPSERGRRAIGGTFKFSVCSTKNCELAHEPLKAPVEVH